MIRTIEEFKTVIGNALPDISAACVGCEWPDCRGWIWVMPDEEMDLMRAGMELLQVNGTSGPVFLNLTRRDEDGNEYVALGDTACHYRNADGSCSVHEARPLACHIYPLALDTTEDLENLWALHLDCKYVDDARIAGRLDQLVDTMLTIIDSLDPAFEEEIYRNWAKAEHMWRPDTLKNHYVKLRDMRHRIVTRRAGPSASRITPNI